MTAQVYMQHGNNGFAVVSIMSEIIEISASTVRTERWATKQVKRKAATFGISLKKRKGYLFAEPQKMQEHKCKFIEALKKTFE